MNKVFNILLFLLLMAFSSVAQVEPDSSYSLLDNKLKVNELKHNFGNIDRGSKANFKFEITNFHDSVLFIKHVTTSCGCTSPEWTVKPIKSGKKGTVKISYDSNKLGSFNKAVYVYTNFADKPIHLTITGSVVPLVSDKNTVSKKSFNIKSELPVKQ